jgi:hypothetical protein
MKISLLVLLLSAGTVVAQATTLPISPAVKARTITSADRGPDLDPLKFADTTFNGLALPGTFDSFVSSSYAIANVWVYAAGDSKAVYQTPVVYNYPDFYKPTWGEVFDAVARQTRCKWSWNPQNRQFKFEPTEDRPVFGVTLADGWQREDRGAYIWHAPKGKQFGMDIYDYGHFTFGTKNGDLPKKVRAYYAVDSISNWPNAPTEKQMSVVKIGNNEALYLKTDTPRPGGVWRQWSLILGGHAYLIVSAMPKEEEKDLVPAIEKMVASFKVDSPTTKPAK